MAHVSWAEAKEIVEISLECGHTNQAIVNDLRGRSGSDLISTIHQVFGLMAVADHPLAEARYESMRKHFSRFNDSPPWLQMRLRLKDKMPAKELI